MALVSQIQLKVYNHNESKKTKEKSRIFFDEIQQDVSYDDKENDGSACCEFITFCSIVSFWKSKK